MKVSPVWVHLGVENHGSCRTIHGEASLAPVGEFAWWHLPHRSKGRTTGQRQIQWRDVDLMDKTLTIRHSKTEAGERVITLNADAMAAVLELRERAKEFFGETFRQTGISFHQGKGRDRRSIRTLLPSSPTLRSRWLAGAPHGGRFAPPPQRATQRRESRPWRAWPG